ncbi:MAG TPA: hypothetical protein VFQ38_14920 [Longimicrobiales bacterium]|nr:hypothetical protein [Longimicrobiales bacterium]
MPTVEDSPAVPADAPPEPPPSTHGGTTAPPARGFRRALAKLLLESGLIVASVLLGFALSEYGERRRDADLAAAAVDNFRREIRANLSELERIRPAHEELLRGLERWSASHPSGETAVEALLRVMPRSGLQINPLDDAAWETATATDALRLMDYPTASLLSRTYLIQRQARGATVALFQERFFERGSFDAASAAASVSLLRVLTQQLVAQEDSLARAYREALRKLPVR